MNAVFTLRSASQSKSEAAMNSRPFVGAQHLRPPVRVEEPLELGDDVAGAPIERSTTHPKHGSRRQVE